MRGLAAVVTRTQLRSDDDVGLLLVRERVNLEDGYWGLPLPSLK
jgi:hypothetical protein